MAECNSRETSNMYPNLSATPLNNQQQFRLNNLTNNLSILISY